MSNPAGPQRWLLPYADVATLLFALFAYQYFLVVREPQPAAPIPAVTAEIHTDTKATPTPMPRAENSAVQRLNEALAGLEPSWFEVHEGADSAVLVLADSPVFFPSASCQLQPDARALLERLVPLVNTPGCRLRIEGHADSQPVTGTRYRSNWELSLGRAASVAEYLLSRGCQPESLALMGLGDRRPVAGNQTPEGRRRNRRVEMIFEFSP